ncbi:ATP-dependent Clp protease proteolytic subunit [Nitratireductor sp. GCM10026969]|uniref:ATP-dependent Clp protease proteolytic subunit n=1 Tax=Nitratireductor sp. GCM10026969 TaxID=3252645 RepID=UPI00361A7881
MTKLCMRSAPLIIFSFFMLVSTFPLKAEVFATSPDDEKEAEAAEVAKIYFLAEMTMSNVSDLMRVLDGLNTGSKNLKTIYLYINSEGGSIDSGKMAYWAIKSSRTPVTAVNLSMVASSATLMFCGAEERRSLERGILYLHAPSTWSDGGAYIQPDQLINAEQLLGVYKDSMADIYRECTSLSDDEIEKILYSENDRLVLSPVEAEEKGIISAIENGIVDAPLSIVIKDASEDDG